MQHSIRYLLPLLLLLSFCSIQGVAQEGGKTTKNFPVPYGPTNTGRDFWISFPANWDLPGSTSYYIRLYITAGTATQVRVFVGGSFRKSVTTIPYDVVTIDLLPVEAQAFTRRDTDPVPPDQIYRNKAVHIEADAPIVVYGMNRTTFTSDGLLALPVNALGREYVIASYPAVIGITQELPSQYMVVSPYDNNTVTIEQPMQSPNHPAGWRTTMTLNKGDVYSAMSIYYGGDMTGATVTASKPVFVAAGQNCAYIPNLITYCCCDHITEQMLPVSSWGKFYHSVPFIGRRNGDIYRVFAAEPNTTVYINGSAYGTLRQRGGEESIGWLEYRATGPELVEFTGDKPIYVAQYNTSQAYDGVPSDPFFYVLSPVEQYQTGLTFSTPAADFPQNYINFVCDTASWRDIEIAPGGTEDWKKLRATGGVGVPKMFKSKINGYWWYGVTIDIRPGTYRIRGPRPFAGYIYGFSAYDSYGYPLSVAVGDIQRKDTNAPEIVKTQDCNGTVIATTTDLPADPVVRSNLATVEMEPDPKLSYNYRLTVTPFEASISASTTYRLEVINRAIDAQAVLTISDMAGNVTYDTIRYTAFNVEITPNKFDFGKVIRDQKVRTIFKITNKSQRPAKINEVRLKSGAQNFTLLSPTGGFTLGPAGSPTASVDAEVEFIALSSGVYSDSLGIRDSCGLSYVALVTGRVVTPVIEVTRMDWGPQVVGLTVPGQIAIRNNSTDDADLIIYGGTGPFGVPVIFTLPDGLPLPFPFTLPPGGSRNVRVAFTPLAVQAYTDSIVFTHNAPPNPLNDSIGELTGRGIQASLVATSKDLLCHRVGSARVIDSVYLINFGTSPVTVRGVASTSGHTGDFRIENLADINNVVIAPSDSVTVIVSFSPTATGDRQMRIIYNPEPAQADTVLTVLDGRGTMPELATIDHDFGSMNIDEKDSLRQVSFWIKPGDCPDSITITGFTWYSDQGGNGVEDFRRVPLDQPVTLYSGIAGKADSVTFDGIFRAQAAGSRIARLRAITLDGPTFDTTSTWTAVGVSQNANISGRPDSVRGLCIADTGMMTATITNGGQVPLTVTALALKNGGDFTILSPAAPFDLIPNETRQIQVRFIPTRKGLQHDTILVSNTTSNPVLEIDISGEALGDAITGKFKLTPTVDNLVELGQDMPVTLVLETLPAGLNIRNYKVIFDYDSRELIPRAGDITLGSSVNPPGGVASINAGETTKGRLVIDVATVAPLLGAGDLITIPFGVIFDTTKTREISGSLVLPNGQCLTIAVEGDTIGVAAICGLNLRMIELTSVTYTLDQNQPNPFNPVTIIQYSLGLDGPTKMLLFDANGKYVQTLVDEYQKPGVYELTVDVTALPSGNYYYKLVSGHWSETKMMTVMK